MRISMHVVEYLLTLFQSLPAMAVKAFAIVLVGIRSPALRGRNRTGRARALCAERPVLGARHCGFKFRQRHKIVR